MSRNRFANPEVREGLNRAVLKRLTGWPGFDRQRLGGEAAWLRILRAGEMERMRERFESLLASIPKDWYVKIGMREYEGCCKSVL